MWMCVMMMIIDHHDRIIGTAEEDEEAKENQIEIWKRKQKKKWMSLDDQ